MNIFVRISLLFSVLLFTGCFFGSENITDCKKVCSQYGFADGVCEPTKTVKEAEIINKGSCKTDSSEACKKSGNCNCYCSVITEEMAKEILNEGIFKALSFSTDELFTITLPKSNKRWIAEFDESILSLESNDVLDSNDNDLISEHFTFSSIKEGVADITFSKKQSQKSNASEELIYRIEVISETPQEDDLNEVIEVINNFDDCVSAGNIIIEGSIRQCETPSGELFIEEDEYEINMGY